MVTKFDGDEETPVLVWGQGSRDLRRASAFGASMLPFIKAGSSLRTELVDRSQIQKGDIISFEAKPGVFITHRVVRLSRPDGVTQFLTKGDNQWVCDSAVQSSQVLGRVTHVNEKSIRTAGMLFLGKIMAWLSYQQACFYLYGSEGRLNQWRLRLEKQGILPKAKMRRRLKFIFNPFCWWVEVDAWKEHLKFFLLSCRLRGQGFKIVQTPQDEPEAMARIWNLSFPEFHTTPERFHQRVCSGYFFEQSFFVLLKRHNKLIAWALISLISENVSTYPPKFKSAEIRVFAIDPALGLKEEVAYFWYSLLKVIKKKVAGNIFFSSHPVRGDAAGLELNPVLQMVCEDTFKPVELCVEWLMHCDKAPLKRSLREPEGVEFRAWCSKDDEMMRLFLNRNQVKKTRQMYGGPDEIDKKGAGIFLAILEGQMVGYCRWILDDVIENCGEVTWMWSARKPAKNHGYIVRLFVDPAFQRRGIGSFLALKTLQNFSQLGCEKGSLIAVDGEPRESFYKGLGFSKTSYFIKLKWVQLD